MNQTFITELKKKCEEIAMQEMDMAAAEKVADAFDKVCCLADTAEKEGLLILEEEAGRLDKNCCSDRFLAYLLMQIVDGYDPQIVRITGMNRCVAFNLPSYDGLINLIYLEGARLIQSGTYPDAVRTYLKSLLPEKILEIAEIRENEKKLLSVREKEIETGRMIHELCCESEKTEMENHSIIARTAYALGRLSDKEIQRILREVENHKIAAALKGLPGKARKRIFDNLSKRLAYLIIEDMQDRLLGESDIEEGCVKILKVIINLAKKGEITGCDMEIMMLVVDVYEQADKKNRKLKEKYKEIQNIIYDVYMNDGNIS